MANWGFYGRDRELERMRRCLSPQKGRDGFMSCYHVIGRRQVGKTELLERAMASGFGDGHPWVGVTIGADKDGNVESAKESLEILRKEAGAKCPNLLDGLRYRYDWPSHRYVETLRHLLHNGVVVTIDEFQRGQDNGIIRGGMQTMLEKMRSAAPTADILREGERWGSLVVMGSHQQRMLDIFGPSGSLLDRSKLGVDLKPWTIRSVFAVAAEHGLLSRPGRFLTLWTAFQGMPGLWKDFVIDEENDGAALRNFLDNPDDREWRRGFLEREIARLSDPKRRFDAKAWLSLAPGLRPVMATLGARENRGGMTVQGILAGMRAMKETGQVDFPEGKPDVEGLWDDLEELREHLGLIDSHCLFLDPGSVQYWRLDGLPLYQTRVFSEWFGHPEGAIATLRGVLDREMDPDAALARLETLEGESLERMVTAVLRARPEVAHGVSLQRARGGLRMHSAPDVEIDAMAALDQRSDRPVLALVDCKRSPKDFKAKDALTRFSRLSAEAGGSPKRARGFWSLPTDRAWLLENAWPGTGDWQRRHLAVAPRFAPDRHWRHLAAKGFDCLGIRDLARELGVDPGPCREPEARRSAQRAARLDAFRRDPKEYRPMTGPVGPALAAADAETENRVLRDWLEARLAAAGVRVAEPKAGDPTVARLEVLEAMPTAVPAAGPKDWWERLDKRIREVEEKLTAAGVDIAAEKRAAETATATELAEREANWKRWEDEIRRQIERERLDTMPDPVGRRRGPDGEYLAEILPERAPSDVEALFPLAPMPVRELWTRLRDAKIEFRVKPHHHPPDREDFPKTRSGEYEFRKETASFWNGLFGYLAKIERETQYGTTTDPAGLEAGLDAWIAEATPRPADLSWIGAGPDGKTRGNPEEDDIPDSTKR